MNDLVPVSELFVPANIVKSIGKAITILDEIEGKTIDEKLANIGKKYQSLTIKGIEDAENYQIVHSALLDIQKVRVAIKRVGKGWRDNLTAQSRVEMAKENELLALFEETENKLRSEKDRIDDLKAIEERRVLLPMRSEMLKKIDIEVNEAEILLMDEKTFAEHYKTLKDIYDQKQAEIETMRIVDLNDKRSREIQELGLYSFVEDKYKNYGVITDEEYKKIKENALVKQAKYKADEVKRIEVEKQKAVEEAKKQAERENKKAILDLKLKARFDKQKLIDQKLKEDYERKQKAEQEVRKKEQARLKELEEKERAEKNKKYIEWKEANNFNPETDKITRVDNTFTLLRVIATIKI